MKKILITSPRTSGHGGIETVITELLNSPLSNDYEITLFIARTKDKTWLKNLPPQIKVLDGGTSTAKCLLTYCQLLMHKSFDLIIDLSMKTIKIDYWIRKLFAKKYKIISWIHFSLHHLEKVKTKDILLADRHWAISSGIAKQIQALDQNAVIDTIYNPIAEQEIIPLSTDDKIHFVYVGRLEWETQKNLQLLLRSLIHLDSSKYYLDIYGSGKDEEQIKAFIKEKKIPCHFYGWCQNPWQEVKTNGIHYLVLSSNYEGFPMAVLEALSHGIPVISTNCPTGPNDLIIDGKNGYLAETEEDYLVALNKALQRNDWNQANIKQSVHQFTKEEYLQHVQDILNHVI